MKLNIKFINLNEELILLDMCRSLSIIISRKFEII